MSAPSPERREPAEITVYGEFNRSITFTATPELMDLLDLAARINHRSGEHRSGEHFNYSFTALVLAFVYSRYGISSWFRDFISKSGVNLRAILSSLNLAGAEEEIIGMSQQTGVPEELFRGGQRTATESSLAWLNQAKRFSEEQKHAWVGLRHMMGALVFDKHFHEEDLRKWGFDRPRWATDYLEFVAQSLPEDEEFWKRIDADVYRSPAQTMSPPGSPPIQTQGPSSPPGGQASFSPPGSSPPGGTAKSPAATASPSRADRRSATSPAREGRGEVAPDWNRAAGFQPDTVKGRDHLDVRREALILAMVLAHKDVEPPISVGLFGDWGSGKSFFMSEMRTLIKGLSERSRAAKGRFCENIVQLEFNAWHYMDSDLWASLAREIFEGLATAVADREQPNLDLERERLREATRSTKDLITATETRVAEVERQLSETQQQLSDIQQERASVEDVARATVKAALETPEVERKVQAVVSDLHLDKAGRSIDEAKEQVAELTKAAGFGRAILAGFRENWQGIVIGLGIVAIGSIFLYAVIGAFREEIAERVAKFVAFVGGVSTVLATILPRVKTILARLNDFRQSLNRNLQDRKEELQKDVKDKQKTLDQERKELEEKQKSQQEELERLRKLSTELDKLQVSRQLVDFIRQRDASSDYRSQLGTVARASQDFRRLSDLMTRSSQARRRKAEGKATPQDEEDATLPQIDRIVLYIDDLDRCPEDKVVDVLQAVHLLLAYPLFVVVVGVDPRWLLHSLEKRSGAFRMALEPGEEERSTDWRSTSLNYLEKIFQIPYTLRPMSPDGFKRLVDDLSSSKSPWSRRGASGSGAQLSVPESGTTMMRRVSSPPDPQRSTREPTTTEARQSRPETSAASPRLADSPERAATAVRSPVLTSPAATTDELVLNPNPAGLELDERERVFMGRLGELIPTPRAAKRFVNVYRLIRASLANEQELAWFLDNREFAAVQVLLAIVTGAPAEASEILRELLERPEQGAWNIVWWELVDGVIKSRLEKPGWVSLNDRLGTLRCDKEIPKTCEGFRKWADDVARYSFYSGRVLLGPQHRQAAAKSP